MRLIKHLKQNLLTYNFNKHKKTCGKPKLLAQILVCLLAVNYVGSVTGAVTNSATMTSACSLTIANHGTPTSVVTTGASKISAVDDFKQGKITINPATLQLTHHASSDLTCLASSTSFVQYVGSYSVYEYISNHENKATIGENSSIYFGLTPVKLKSKKDYYLAGFEYRSSSKNPAVTIELNKLKAKLTNNSLKSIVICSTLTATANDALYVKGKSSITLTDGLIIAKSAKLFGGTGAFAGLVLQDGSLTADIHNYGEISGPDAVQINNFLLKSPHGGAAKFYNHGIIHGTKTNAFLVNSTSTDTFELTNCKHGEINGKLTLGSTNTVHFNVINYGIITTTVATVTASTDAATTHKITNYTGKPFSQLVLTFPETRTTSNHPIIDCKNYFTLGEDARIVFAGGSLQSNPKILQKKTKFIIVSGSITLAGNVNDFLFTSLQADKTYLEATNTELNGNKITAELYISQQILPNTVPHKHYMPDMVKAVNATKHFAEASNTAAAIDKAIRIDTIEIAGIDLKSKIAGLRKFNMFTEARNNCSSPDEFFDILLPDSSNSQLIANHKIANKLIRQVSARIASKSMSIAKARVNKIFADRGANSCEASNNISASAWTSLNYLHSETKKNDKKQSYNKLQARVFSLGADTELAYRNITLGASYGFASSENKTYGGKGGINLSKMPGQHGKEDIKTHAFTIYSAMNIDKVDVHVAMSLGFSKHEVKEEIAEKYNSRIIGLHSSATYPLDFEYVNLDIVGSFGVNIIHTDEHDNKYGNKQTPKEDHNLTCLGLMVAITDVIDLNKLNLDYKVGLGGKYTISSDKKYKIDVAAGYTIDYKKRPVGPLDFNIDANLNLQIQKNIHAGLNLNFEMGKDIQDFGISTSFRYLF